MQDERLLIEAQPDPADVQFLEDRINEFNIAATGYDDGRLLASFVRNAEGRIVAGVFGWTWGGACEIRYLWVDAAYRGHGYGTRLLQAAEREAAARGCITIVLSSHSFQAPDFYRKHGYTIIGVRKDYPRGYADVFLQKQLSPAQ